MAVDEPGVQRMDRCWRTGRRESGYVMIVTMLLFPILIISVAFVVDVSMFFFKSIQVQRAADAAALAGVTRMPRVTEAIELATDLATRNGYKNGANGVTVNISAPMDTNKRLIVTIRDDSTLLFFGKSLLKNWKISKTSTAEYVSNIPLGSKENVIGNGSLTDSGPSQGFWLAISGPCAPKEAGDQFASRYDGTAIGAGRWPSIEDSRNNAMVCDYNKSDPSNPTNQALSPYPSDDVLDNYQKVGEDTAVWLARLRRNLLKARNDKDAVDSGHFPAVSLNRDWDEEGYNYIVDVPCKNNVAGGSPPPPPCTDANQQFGDDSSTANSDLVIQIYDPVFNPVSVKTFLETGEGSQRDRYGLAPNFPTQPVATPCAPATPAGCNPDFGVGNPGPDDVRVRTKFSLYGPDLSPLDYSDDEVVKIMDKTYGSCVKSYDTPVAWAPRVDTLDAPYQPLTVADAAGQDCAAASDQWVTMARISASSLAKRGRYRINVRTLTAPDSYGTNSFSIRSFFAPSTATVPAHKVCADASVPALACASVSGDSSMSVFATAPAIQEFYLAKLSPPSLYRGKTVMVRLWDAGEGGSSLQVLRPKAAWETACNYGGWANPDPTPEGLSPYCAQKIEWRIGQTGVNNYGDPVKALQDTTKSLSDVCSGKGLADQFELIIAGDQKSVETCGGIDIPTAILQSRYGPYVAGDRGKFNDRLVNVKINVPADYGCAAAAPADCVDVDPSSLPEQGWWKIKYIPQKFPNGTYRPMTDRSTWTVELLGEPVHLVLNK